MTRRVDPLTATPSDGISENQATAIRIMHGDLGRACPELISLSFTEAGDLIIKLRAEVLALEEGTETR